MMETTLCRSVIVFVLTTVASTAPPEDPLEALAVSIPGSPGEDYPIYSSPPDTSFLCDGFIEGYYADPEAECQAFHICANFGIENLVKFSFLCPNGTLFNQKYFICDWWFNVDCSQAEDFYSLNEEVAAAGIEATAAVVEDAAMEAGVMDAEVVDVDALDMIAADDMDSGAEDEEAADADEEAKDLGAVDINATKDEATDAGVTNEGSKDAEAADAGFVFPEEENTDDDISILARTGPQETEQKEEDRGPKSYPSFGNFIGTSVLPLVQDINREPKRAITFQKIEEGEEYFPVYEATREDKFPQRLRFQRVEEGEAFVSDNAEYRELMTVPNFEYFEAREGVPPVNGDTRKRKSVLVLVGRR